MLIPVLVITIIRISLEGVDQHPRCAFLVIFVQNENKASSHNTLLTMVQVLVVLVITAGLLMWGRIRSDVVALCSMLALVLMGIITPQEGLAGFSNPVVIMIGVTVSASMCFMSPIATTPNAMVMSVGRYSFMDYVRVGLPLQAIILVAMVWLIPMIYPL